ncbi:MAG: 23S rRNA (guanosine-2'-O-)-methyltransferase RlmB [Syntrophorhabdaceae bacterium PtaU1.Bin034]|nr:MAG: 23S rRNA (guanosine-2'-O-)-methyltransferase RlmB [Syntrophorhabdaceae bacterium PtaU1.Bin034]
MLYLANRNSILESLKSHPEKAARLWIEAGHERTSSEVIDEARKAGVSVRIVPKEQFSRKFKGVKSHFCLEGEEFAYTDPDVLLSTIPSLETPFFSAFDGIYDPQNLGNVIRTAACLGVDALVIPRDNAAKVTDTVLNVARGGTEHVRISRAVNMARYIEDLKKRNIFCFGLDERADKNIFDMDLTMPLCLVLGGEEGLRRLTRERCDMLLKIPTSGIFPSLNVANAFAIAAYEVVRQRAVKRLK